MKNRFYLWLAACVVLLLGISLSVPAKSAETSRPGFTEADTAYYLPDSIYTLVDPGVNYTLIDFEIPDDRAPLVTFSLTGGDGQPLDLYGKFTPGAIDVRHMLSYIPVGEVEKINYHGRSTRDRNGEYTYLGDGVYTYKFTTVLPEDYEVDATHTLASTARRDLRAWAELGLDRYYDNNVYNFVPSGAADPLPRDIVTTDACNKCHMPIAEHGGTYREVQVCTQCHNPDLLGGDGEELSYEFSALVHRIHSSQEPEVGEIHYPVHPVGEPGALKDCQVCHTGGTPTADMPMVADPNPIPTCDGSGKGMTEIVWGDAGNVEIRINSANGKLFAKSAGAGSAETGNWVTDGKAFFLVDADDGAPVSNGKVEVDLTVFGCAGNAPYDYTSYLMKPLLDDDGQPVEDEDGNVVMVVDAGELHSNWMTQPSRVDCGSCHMDIDWETGEGHQSLAQDSDQYCSFCHWADSGNEFDPSVKGAHTVALASDVMAGVLVTIKEVTNTGPGQSPTVVFSLNDKNGPLNPAALETFWLTLTGPNDDFAVNIRENALGKVTAVGSDWSYTFNGTVPSDAEGSYSVGYEGRITRDVNGESERDSAENAIVAVAVTDSEPMARRMIVDDAKCEACHSNLSLHGDNRKNANEYCQTCHMPAATDEAVRLEGEPESIHFKYMVHKIHRGAELKNLPYIVYGFRNSVHDYSEVHYPGDLRNCEACHLEGTYTVDAIPEGALPTYSPAAAIPEMEPITATCLSCHDGDATASHALANTSSLGESCDTCHGDGKTYSVTRVHAR